MTHQMPPGAQVAFARDWLERQGIPSETIDVESYIDRSLSYEENIKLMKRRFGLGRRGADAPVAADGLSAAECDVAIGNFEAGFNSDVMRDACMCGHPDACEKLARAAVKRKPKQEVVKKKKPEERIRELRAEANKIRSTVQREIRELKPLGQRSEVGAAMGIMPKRGVVVETAVGEVVFAKTRQPSARQLKRWESMYKKAEKISGEVAKRQVEFIKERKPPTPAPKAARKPKKKPAPQLPASQKVYLAIHGFVMVKRGGKYVRIMG